MYFAGMKSILLCSFLFLLFFCGCTNNKGKDPSSPTSENDVDAARNFINAVLKSNFKEASEKLQGACGITFTSGDIALSSKTLVEFAKANEGFKIQTGVMNGQIMSADQIRVLANLPSRTVLLGQVAGVLQAPIRNLAVVLNASIRSLAVVLNAVSQKKEK